MDNSRREFLTKLGATVGAITIGRNLMKAMPGTSAEVSNDGLMNQTEGITIDVADFRYAPKEWQSTYCFPDDPWKSLVGKHGELLYGHEGAGKDERVFPHVVSFGLQGKDSLPYIGQKLESPSIPIITTTLDGGDVLVKLTSFATKNEDEGRVDNVWLEVVPKNSQSIQCRPEIVIKSQAKFSNKPEDDFASILNENGKVFLVVNSAVEYSEAEGTHKLELNAGTASVEKPLRYFVRFPQEGQEFDKIEDGLEEPEEMLNEARLFWQTWKPTEGKVTWELDDPYQSFMIACARNIQQAREVKDGKKIFQVGPTVYRGLWVVDGNFLLEAARYLGHDKEAQEGLESIWNRQDDKGLFTAGAGEAHWKDTAVALYALVRQAELSQNWEFFREIYPDAFKAVMALKDLRDKAKNDGSTLGKYGLLPRGFGDSGIGGIRDEFTNTLWTLLGVKALKEAGIRLRFSRVIELRDFYGELFFAFDDASRAEMKKHPKGFDYLPMLLGSDSKWQEADVRNQPRPQAAQIYLSHAIYPGLLLKPDNWIVNGHVNLMQAVTKEEIPIETGWLPNDALWPYNAPIFAQVCLWLGKSDLARKTFIGFLNHASPLYAWREEQSLQDAANFQFIGDMPHNWASAECIRYLRHMMILEDEKNLLLFNGIGLQDMLARKPLILSGSPTKWGRISLSIEPVDDKVWRTTYKREDFDEKTYPPFEYIMMPAKFGGKIAFNGATGAKWVRNGEKIIIPGKENQWECKWKLRD